MNIGICKFCGTEKKLIRAHIIPESLYPTDKNGGRRHIVLDLNGEIPNSQLQNGYYDPNLVCRECEDLFSAGDDYAKGLLIDRRSESVKKSGRGTAYFEYADVDYKKLKLFFISLLWRAHATSLRSLSEVKIGSKYEAIARTMIRDGNPGSPDDFAVLMLRVAEGQLDRMGASPIPRKMLPNNIRVYEFLLFGYIAYVKVDQRPYGDPPRSAQLSPGKPLVMLEQSLEKTSFLRFTAEAHLKAEATKERLKVRSE